jgi:hypothetical protein
MKVTKQADKNLWWHEKEVECGRCGQVVQLEVKDVRCSEHFIAHDDAHVVIECSHCAERLRLQRPAKAETDH